MRGNEGSARNGSSDVLIRVASITLIALYQYSGPSVAQLKTYKRHSEVLVCHATLSVQWRPLLKISLFSELPAS